MNIHAFTTFNDAPVFIKNMFSTYLHHVKNPCVDGFSTYIKDVYLINFTCDIKTYSDQTPSIQFVLLFASEKDELLAQLNFI